ncbi:MAG: translation elongation factor-like protein [Candidatus Rokubacteria bacterium]|nr:translation elongation factor-like protein [Candidatus Rokubacteria bacterium]
MATEEKIGSVTDYFAKIGVAGIRLTDGELRVGDRVRFHGHTTDFTQVVESLQVEHQAVERADRGTDVAVKVQERVRRHDQVLRVRE